jgi:phospholipid/cholesterol/gamma-HCH transport system substrate-binding protein
VKEKHNQAKELHRFVGGGVLILLFLFIIFSHFSPLSFNLQSPFFLQARFSSVEGISEGSKILLAGVPVGEVAKIYINPDDYSVLTRLHISAPIELPLDTSASIVSEGMFGDKNIRLIPGGSFDILQNGDEIEYVQNAVDFKKILENMVITAEAKANINANNH